jgi:hypothetical protein
MAALVKEAVTDVIDKERHGVREGFARMADEDCNCLTRLGGSNDGDNGNGGNGNGDCGNGQRRQRRRQR